MNYIITKHKEFFDNIGEYNYCDLEDMILPETIAIDTETTGLIPRNCDIFCVQIGTGTNNYIVHMYDDNYEFKDVIPYLNGKILIGHNILFDLGFMYKYGFFPKQVYDTMLATRILYNGDIDNLRADFGTVMYRELNAIYDKTDQKNIHIVKLSQQSTIEYSFNDVDRLIELHDTLLSKIKKGGFLATYELHCRYIKALAYIEQCGMPISPEKWKAKMIIDLENAVKGKEIVENYIYDNIPEFRDNQLDMFDNMKRIHVSVTSPKQMLQVFEKFKIPTKDKDGKDSINENIINKSDHEFVPIWTAYQNANHRVTTFGETIYNKIENNRVYTNFNPMVDTARLSTRKGHINFLNFPADKLTRQAFVANEGNVMIVCDYSGQETVVAADLSGDIAMTKSVVEGADLHCAFARILFPEIKDLDDETITKEHKSKRNFAKSPRFAFQYGGSAYTIHQNQGIPLKRAYIIEDAFKELHSGLYEWGDKELTKALKTGYIESADGWKLKLPKFEEFNEYKISVDRITRDQWTIYKQGKLDYKKKFEEEEAEREYTYKYPESVKYYNSVKKVVSQYFKLRGEYQRLCLNNPVQTRGAHQIKLASCLIFEWIVENNLVWKVLMCNSVHDEIVLESKLEYAEQSKMALENCMLKGGNHYLTNLKIKADANIGASWGEAK